MVILRLCPKPFFSVVKRFSVKIFARELCVYSKRYIVRKITIVLMVTKYLLLILGSCFFFESTFAQGSLSKDSQSVFTLGEVVVRSARISEINSYISASKLQRWLDLVRWGIAEDVMNKFLALPLQGGGVYSM